MLNTVYELETAIYRTERRCGEIAEEVKQAKFALRSARTAEVEYSGFRAFLDKLSGKYVDRAEALGRDVRKADAALKALLRQKETETGKLSALREQRASLPALDTLRTPENEAQWAALEASLCAEQLMPLLQETGEALLDYRSMLRGEYPILTIEERQSKAAQPHIRAQRCAPLLARLTEATKAQGVPLDPGSFFRSPDAFLIAAADHNRRDRVNQALDQTQALRHTLSRLIREGKE